MQNKIKGCVNAYLNLSVKTNGGVSPCCMSDYFYKTDIGSNTLNQESIINFWNSKSRKEFIEQLDAGVQLPECFSCWNEERAGKDSKRIRDNKTFENTELKSDMLPLVLDMSMGNLCNIKCRICSPLQSSPWQAEEEKIVTLYPNRTYLKHKYNSQAASFDYSNDFFWKDILKLLPNVTKYDFAGGEPFFIEKHWDIVRTAVEHGWSKSQHIHYNTNGTIFPEKYVHLFEEFKIVDIQISSDGVGQKFEYMRHPAKWNKVENNIQRFIDAKESSKTEWWLGTCISVSAFNVYDFFETFEHYASKGLGIYVNVVHDHHGVRILHPSLKKELISKLKSQQSQFKPAQWERERDMICRHLENTTYNVNDWNEFWQEIEIRDKFRGESFKDTFSEYYELINKLGLVYVER